MVVFLNWFPLRTYLILSSGDKQLRQQKKLIIIHNYSKSPYNLLIFLLPLHMVIFKIFQDVSVGIRLIQLTSTKWQINLWQNTLQFEWT